MPLNGAESPFHDGIFAKWGKSGSLHGGEPEWEMAISIEWQGFSASTKNPFTSEISNIQGFEKVHIYWNEIVFMMLVVCQASYKIGKLCRCMLKGVHFIKVPFYGGFGHDAL